LNKEETEYTLYDFAPELIAYLVLTLDVKDALSFSLVNRLFRDIVQDEYHWKNRLERDFPERYKWLALKVTTEQDPRIWRSSYIDEYTKQQAIYTQQQAIYARQQAIYARQQIITQVDIYIADRRSRTAVRRTGPKSKTNKLKAAKYLKSYLNDPNEYDLLKLLQYKETLNDGKLKALFADAKKINPALAQRILFDDLMVYRAKRSNETSINEEGALGKSAKVGAANKLIKYFNEPSSKLLNELNERTVNTGRLGELYKQVVELHPYYLLSKKQPNELSEQDVKWINAIIKRAAKPEDTKMIRVMLLNSLQAYNNIRGPRYGLEPKPTPQQLQAARCLEDYLKEPTKENRKSLQAFKHELETGKLKNIFKIVEDNQDTLEEEAQETSTTAYQAR